MLSPTGFRFVLNRTPNINYFTYSAPIPTLSLGDYDQQTPFVALPYPGDKLRFEPLSLRFRVDEDLVNYMEIHNWLISLGYPESFDQNAFKSGQALAFKNNDVYSDGSLIVMSSNQNPNLNINFEDMFPVSLTELTFDASLDDIQYLEATVTFRYKLYTIDRI
tara:strand:+ start:3444 stop:3932 length:489 start_codon:yes stop_codon:yes gene_type:complete